MCQNDVTARVECHEEELRLVSPVSEEELRLVSPVSEEELRLVSPVSERKS